MKLQLSIDWREAVRSVRSNTGSAYSSQCSLGHPLVNSLQTGHTVYSLLNVSVLHPIPIDFFLPTCALHCILESLKLSGAFVPLARVTEEKQLALNVHVAITAKKNKNN